MCDDLLETFPESPIYVSLPENFSFVDQLTRDDMKDHVTTTVKWNYHMGRICASAKWSVQLYYNLYKTRTPEYSNINPQIQPPPPIRFVLPPKGPLNNQPYPNYNYDPRMPTNQSGIVFLAPSNPNLPNYQASSPQTPVKESNRYMEPGPHFSPTFMAGKYKELKFEIRVDCRQDRFWVRINFIDLKDLNCDYKISYITKTLEEHVLKDFSSDFTNDAQTTEIELPRDLHLRFAKTTLVLAVGIAAASNHRVLGERRAPIVERDALRMDSNVFTSPIGAAGASRGEISQELQDLENMFEKGLMADASLIVEGQSIAVHKHILAARSTVFLEMFTTDQQDPLSQPEVEIEDLTYHQARQMLKFLYIGELRGVDEEGAKKMLVVASKYAIRALFSKCEGILAGHLNVDNAAEILKLADTNNAQLLKSKATDFLVKNVKSVPEATLSTLDAATLTKLLMGVTSQKS